LPEGSHFRRANDQAGQNTGADPRSDRKERLGERGVTPLDSQHKAFFFDRDGTLIVDRGYIRRTEDIEFFPDTVATLQQLQARGFLLVVVSNQSGIARGLITNEEARAVSDAFCRSLGENGITIASAHFCPHHPDAGCECRKPRPGMLLEAGRALGIDFSQSYMVGDRRTDCEAGAAVGCTPVLLKAGAADEVIPPGWHVIQKLSDLLVLV
jgi:histidinol-phosphate phosphatase family protein